MELFSEVNNCYYQVLRHLLCSQNSYTIQDIQTQICQEGFEESMLSIIPRLEDGSWGLFKREGEWYRSKLSSTFAVPFSDLQRSYLKALLSDPRIGLFLDEEQSDVLKDMLADVEPLWRQDQFYYFDRFIDGDPYQDAIYRQNFRMLLQAQKNRQYVEIDYTSPKGNRLHHYYFPARLEYSVKNDKFRLLALKQTGHETMRLEVLNVSRIQKVCPVEKTISAQIDINTVIRNSYYKEPLTLRIKNERNALERAMLHFANYEKNTFKIDENTYECEIYYNRTMETELLIEVMSFGPMITVTGADHFLEAMKERLQKQIDLAAPAAF